MEVRLSQLLWSIWAGFYFWISRKFASVFFWMETQSSLCKIAHQSEAERIMTMTQGQRTWIWWSRRNSCLPFQPNTSWDIKFAVSTCAFDCLADMVVVVHAQLPKWLMIVLWMFRKMTELFLYSENSFGAEGGKAIAAGLMFVTRLQDLNLRWSAVLWIDAAATAHQISAESNSDFLVTETITLGWKVSKN